METEVVEFWIVGMILMGCGSNAFVRMVGLACFVAWFISII